MFRFDRLLSIYFFSHVAKLTQGKELRIPILMYHSISRDSEDGVHPYYRTCTSPEVFENHMKFLRDYNYKVISLSDAVYLLNNQRINQSTNLPINQSANQPVNYVVITFDDGFRDFHTNAFPILEKYGFTATMFLPTGFINNGSRFKEKNCLNWDEVRELHSKGIEFGSHTVTHPQLKTLNKKQIEYEVRKSKEDIEDNLGKSIDSFSYPYKFPEEDKKFTMYLRDILNKYGYKNGVSTILGMAKNGNNKFFLKRIPMNSCDDISLLRAKLQGGYDWLHMPQLFSKHLKNTLGKLKKVDKKVETEQET